VYSYRRLQGPIDSKRRRQYLVRGARSGHMLNPDPSDVEFFQEDLRMDANRLRELTDTLDVLRRKLIEMKGKDPNDAEKYWLYPPVEAQAIARAEEKSGLEYPASYRSFLQRHNGWLGFWPGWSLVGIETESNAKMHKDVSATKELLDTVADAEEEK